MNYTIIGTGLFCACVGFFIGLFVERKKSTLMLEEFKQSNNDQLQNQLIKITQLQTQLDSERISSEKIQNELKTQLNLAQNQVAEYSEKAAAASATNQHLEERLIQQKSEIESVHQQMTLKFENLASQLLEDKSKKFTEQNLSNIKIILDPLREQIKDFEKKVNDTYSAEKAERGHLKGELSKLFDLNQKMTLETATLTRALKGDTQTQGAWGEMVLESVLEKSGLRKDEEYIIQGEGYALKDESGTHQKPDVLVRLPEGKHIIIDSKVSLKSYEKYLATTDESEKEKFAFEHTDSLKRHLDSLGQKKYHANEKLESPDFTLLFMPLEPAFALAFRIRPELLQIAWEKNIAIVSPTTLLTSLRTVSALWKQDRQNKNARDIAKTSGQLYEKFYGLMSDLENLGKRLTQAKESYDETLSKLSHGKGNLIRQVEKLKDLGAKTDKNLLDLDVTSGLIE